MNAREQSRLNAYDAIAEFFDTHEKDLELIPSSKDIIHVFKSIYNEIQSLKNNFSGAGSNVLFMRQNHDLLVKKLSSFCDSVNAWQLLHDHPANPVFSIPKSGILQKTQDSLEIFTREVINEFSHFSEKPDDSILDPQALNDIKTILNAFIKARKDTKLLKTKKADFNTLLREKMREMDRQLAKTDALLKLFKVKNPLLYIAYNESRKIRKKIYEAKPLFNDMIYPASTRTITTIDYQSNAWLVIHNRSTVGLSVHLSLLRDIALGDGVPVPPESTIYRQVKNLHSDPQAKYLVVRNEDKKDGGILEIRMG